MEPSQTLSWLPSDTGLFGWDHDFSTFSCHKPNSTFNFCVVFQRKNPSLTSVTWNSPISFLSSMSFTRVLQCCQHQENVLTVTLRFPLSYTTLSFPPSYKAKVDGFARMPTGFSPFQQYECLYCSLNAVLQILANGISVAFVLEAYRILQAI